MKRILLSLVAFISTFCLYSQDALLLYLSNTSLPYYFILKDITISHTDTKQIIHVKDWNLVFSTLTSEIDSVIFIKTDTLHNVIFANLYCPDDNHPHAIDLGLPSGTLWSCCNVGATKPEEYGGYYAWGETEEKEEYSHVSYQYNTGEDVDGDSYYDDWHDGVDTYGLWHNIGNCIGENEYGTGIYDIAGTQYDVAHVLWGDKWQMPTFDQIFELIHCYSRWMSINDVTGGEFIGSYNNFIFLPAGGSRYPGNDADDRDFQGFYWASTQSSWYTPCADFLYFTWDYGKCYTNMYPNCRADGYSVRPVLVP